MIIIDIVIFFCLALVLGVRLWSVLGQRPDRPSGLEGRAVKRAQGKIVYLHQQGTSFETVYPDFDELHFLKGAEKAFDWVVQAYHGEDFQKLEGLLHPDTLHKVYRQGVRTIPQMERAQAAVVRKSIVRGDIAQVEVLFQLSQDKSRQEVTWVFERAVSSANPNWVICL